MVIDRQYIDYLKLLHGSYNTVVALLFMYQGSLGWRIRTERKAGGRRNAAIIRRHRRGGPIFAVLGIGGYFSGTVLVYLDKGHLYEYPLHLTAGTCITLAIMTTYLVSRLIRGPESRWRTPHFLIGLFIILMYLIQIVLGLDILL